MAAEDHAPLAATEEVAQVLQAHLEAGIPVRGDYNWNACLTPGAKTAPEEIEGTCPPHGTPEEQKLSRP